MSISKTISQKILKEINQSKNILLHLHPSPDGDCVGSALAMMHFLKKKGKNVTVVGGDSEFPLYLKTIPGTEEIIPQSVCNTDLNKFDLFIILDSGSNNQISKVEEIKLPQKLRTINIDHHPSNSKYGNINLVDPKSPATCQIIYELLESFNYKLDKNTAACLFVGIYTDTGGFKYNPSWRTFDIAAKLVKINKDVNKIILDIENSDTPDRIKFISLVLSTTKTYFSDHVAIASIDFQTIINNNLSSTALNSSDISNMLKSVIGWDIGICMIETKPNNVKLSFRTRDSEIYDLSKIALATNAGGGHKAAAGATIINKSLDEAKDYILKIIQKIHPELGKP